MSAVNQLHKVAVRLAAWSDRAEEWQHRLPFDHPADFKDYLRREVEAGRANLCEILNGSEVVGMLGYTVQTFEQKELVILAAYSGDSAFDYATYLDAFLATLGRKLGCVSIRFHTRRPGLIHRAVTEGDGWRVADVVLRKTL